MVGRPEVEQPWREKGHAHTVAHADQEAPKGIDLDHRLERMPQAGKGLFDDVADAETLAEHHARKGDQIFNHQLTLEACEWMGCGHDQLYPIAKELMESELLHQLDPIEGEAKEPKVEALLLDPGQHVISTTSLQVDAYVRIAALERYNRTAEQELY